VYLQICNSVVKSFILEKVKGRYIYGKKRIHVHTSAVAETQNRGDRNCLTLFKRSIGETPNPEFLNYILKEWRGWKFG
jgi:hypothetical protein